MWKGLLDKSPQINFSTQTVTKMIYKVSERLHSNVFDYLLSLSNFKFQISTKHSEKPEGFKRELIVRDFSYLDDFWYYYKLQHLSMI